MEGSNERLDTPDNSIRSLPEVLHTEETNVIVNTALRELGLRRYFDVDGISPLCCIVATALEITGKACMQCTCMQSAGRVFHLGQEVWLCCLVDTPVAPGSLYPSFCWYVPVTGPLHFFHTDVLFYHGHLGFANHPFSL